jgi:peptidyl-prolyl cis-trans isomerase-like protein 2
MTDEEFIKSDIITIQDPQNVEKRDLTTFDYVKRELKITDASEGGTLSGINLAVSGVSKVLKEIAEKVRCPSTLYK